LRGLDALQTSDLITLPGRLGLEFVLLGSVHVVGIHLLFSLLVLLSLELLEELPVSHEDAVWVSLLLGGSWQQFRCWIPSNLLLWVDARVERLETSSLWSSLLTELIRSVAEHNTLVVADGGFWPVTAVSEASTRAIDILF